MVELQSKPIKGALGHTLRHACCCLFRAFQHQESSMCASYRVLTAVMSAGNRIDVAGALKAWS